MHSVETLLQRFVEVANNPRQAFEQLLQSGHRVVGVAPGYTPEPVIHAMGMVPFGVWGADVPIEEAKAYFPAFIPSMLQSILELGIQGKYEGLTALVIPALSDSTKALGQNWKYAVPGIPFIPATYPQNRRGKPGRAFTKACYERVAEDLHKLTGAELTEAALAQSIEIYNAHNACMRKLSEVAAKHDCMTPALRSAVFKSAWFMKKEEHTKLVLELIQALEALEPQTQKLRILTSGLLCDAPGLLQILEECNMTVVGDDILAETRQYRTDATEGDSPMEKLVDQFARMDCCSLLYDAEKKRGPMLVELAKERQAEGVVLFLTKFSDPEEFDYVPIKKSLEAADIPLILIEIDRQMDRFDQAQTALETFRDLLETRRFA